MGIADSDICYAGVLFYEIQIENQIYCSSNVRRQAKSIALLFPQLLLSFGKKSKVDTITLLGTAFALAMDAFAVSVAAGVHLTQVNFRHIFRLSWHFGFFQYMMPVIGWSAGLTIRSFIERYDHWIAFALLVFVGGNMIRESLHKKTIDVRKKDPTKGMTLVMLSVATSIDALAVGLSLSMLKISIWIPALVIGVTAALLTGAGLRIGEKVGSSSHLSNYADAVGGIVLLAIALKILHQHGAITF